MITDKSISLSDKIFLISGIDADTLYSVMQQALVKQIDKNDFANIFMPKHELMLQTLLKNEPSLVDGISLSGLSDIDHNNIL
jgi:hypothetical protein